MKHNQYIVQPLFFPLCFLLFWLPAWCCTFRHLNQWMSEFINHAPLWWEDFSVNAYLSGGEEGSKGNAPPLGITRKGNAALLYWTTSRSSHTTLLPSYGGSLLRHHNSSSSSHHILIDWRETSASASASKKEGQTHRGRRKQSINVVINVKFY